MAYPAVQSTSTYSAASGTSHALTMPSGVASGDLLIASVHAGTGFSSLSWPVGWTEFYGDTLFGTRCSSAYRVATGSGDQPTITLGVSTDLCAIMHRISGQHASSAPEASTASNGADQTPDSPSLTASWGGTEENLWLSIYHIQDVNSITTAPTNYTNSFNATSTGSFISVGGARRNNNVATENPGAWSLGVHSEDWNAYTIVIRPAAAGGTTDGALSASGTGTATFIGKSNFNGVLASSGVGTATFTGKSTFTGVLSVTSSGVATFTGVGLTVGTLSVTSQGVATFIGKSNSNGVLAAPATSSVSFTSQVSAQSPLNSSSLSTVNFIGNYKVLGILSATGAATANFTGATVQNLEDYFRRYLNDRANMAAVGIDQNVAVVSESDLSTYLRRYLNDKV